MGVREKINLMMVWMIRKLHLQENVYYVGSSESLPMPLNAEEEQQLLKQLGQDGQQARQKLIEHNLRLVVYIARKFENTGIPVEDLISIGTIGLIKAVNTFDNEKKIKLATYASRCIENEILMQLRRTSKMRYEVSLDEPLKIDYDGNELLLSDVMGTEEDSIYQHIEKDIDYSLLQTAMSQLTKRERMIVELRFGLRGKEERTQKEVADLLGISQSYISRLEKKIIGRLQREFQKLE
ncbi:MAG: RNA polymerase sporulation sigma factor SigE [Peptococcaceae bacterium]|nr:RNA polymerase sporulation sigma factor SigE [Peptococcaceae bacterium]